MDHSAGFGYPLWAVAKDLVKRYGPWGSIWLYAMGHSAKLILSQCFNGSFKTAEDKVCNDVI
jgi:hypothetical protein